MIDYLIGVDGGGTKTRVRLAARSGAELATGASGPSGLRLGIDAAWQAVNSAVAQAFATLSIDSIPFERCAIGLGLAGVHNSSWADQFRAANPGYAALTLATDGYSTLMGAHGGAPGVIVAVGTGSVGEALLPDGRHVEVGGWGFPSGDEAGGAWMGLRAIAHAQQVVDGRAVAGPLARDLIDHCGGARDAIQVWLGTATQTDYAALSRFVVLHGESDPVARSILLASGIEVERMALALDPGAALPLALCGGLADYLLPYLPEATRARARAPQGDSSLGALRMIELHLKEQTQ